jgi:hypothetical protein
MLVLLPSFRAGLFHSLRKQAVVFVALGLVFLGAFWILAFWYL